MHSVKTAVSRWSCSAVGSCRGPCRRKSALGAQGAEGEPNRLQQWLVPSPDPAIAGACGVVSSPRRRAVSAGADRACFDPERAASRANAAARIPRAGGLAGGARLCGAGAGTARAMAPRAENISRIRAAATRRTIPAPAVRPPTRSPPRWIICAGNPSSGGDGTIIVGALRRRMGRAGAGPSEDSQDVAAIIAFAPGRGGHANDFPNQVCAPHTLMAAAAEFGKAARVPVTWLVAANDSYFSPAFSRQLADAFRGAGGERWIFSVLAGLRQRGPLAAGNRWRRKARCGRDLIAR